MGLVYVGVMKKMVVCDASPNAGFTSVLFELCAEGASLGLVGTW